MYNIRLLIFVLKIDETDGFWI